MTISWGSLFLLALKMLKMAKSLKVILAAGSATAYAWLFSWEVAFVLMWAIGIHEMGHVYGMRRCGIPTKGFYFVPFLGGAAIGEAARTEWDDVYVTAMGPTWGLISSLPFIFMWQVTGEVKWAGYSTLILLINLINLLPIMPLDGGRLTKSLVSSGGSTALWIYLFLLCTAGFWFMWVNGLYLFLGLSIIGALEVVAEARRSKSERRPALSSLEWAVTASWFIILAAVLYGIILAFQSVEGAGLVAKVLKST